jgi:hypothetical protein
MGNTGNNEYEEGRSAMLKRNGIALFLAIMTLSFGALTAALSDGDNAPDNYSKNLEKRCVTILSDFLNRGLGSNEKTFVIGGGKLRIGRPILSESYGYFVEFWLEGNFGFIDLDPGLVSYWVDSNNRLRMFPAGEGEDGIKTLHRRIQNEIVIQLDEAENVARDFVVSHVGKNTLDNLESTVRSLVYSRDTAEYEFEWSRVPVLLGKTRVYFGERTISVHVNPFTGQVRSFSRDEAQVRLPPIMDAESCLQLVQRFLEEKGEQRIEVVSMYYLGVKTDEGNSLQPTWYVNWVSRNPGTSPWFVHASPRQLRIDATTGDISFSDSVAPAPHKHLGAER